MTVKRRIKWVPLVPLTARLATAGACVLDQAAVKRQLRDTASQPAADRHLPSCNGDRYPVLRR